VEGKGDSDCGEGRGRGVSEEFMLDVFGNHSTRGHMQESSQRKEKNLFI
jgi:hypothetical protein